MTPFGRDAWDGRGVLTVVAGDTTRAVAAARAWLAATPPDPGGRADVGGVPFDPRLCVSGFWPTLEDELCLGSAAPAGRDRVRRLAARLGLGQLLGRHPAALSTGETTKAVLAAALAVAPRAVVIECGLRAVDAASRRAIPAVVAEEAPGTALVVVEPVAPSVAGRVWWLDEGRGGDAAEPPADATGGALAFRRLARRAAPPGEPVLALDRLAVRRNDRPVVDGITFAAHAGDVVALTGPNGSGKTTLLEALLGWLPVAGGGCAPAPGQWPSPFGYSPASAVSVTTEITLLDEVTTYRPPGLSLAAVFERLAEFGLPAADLRVQLSDSPPHRKLASVLSTILLARPVLLLDEPTLLLAPPHQEIVRAAIRAATASAIIVASHDDGFISSLRGLVM